MLNNRMYAGRLRHRIQIVRPDGVQDSIGGVPQNEMAVVCTCWAEIETLTGRDMLVSEQFMSRVNLQLKVRYRPDIDAACRVWFNKKTFQITAVMNPDQRTKMLVLNAVEINDSRQQFTTPAESSL